MSKVEIATPEMIAAEEKEIIAKAKANGTYLKAPNGKPPISPLVSGYRCAPKPSRSGLAIGSWLTYIIELWRRGIIRIQSVRLYLDCRIEPKPVLLRFLAKTLSN